MTPTLVPGEEELGVQARCPKCEWWWPIDDDDGAFWYWSKGRRSSYCRACWSLWNRERHVRARGRAA